MINELIKDVRGEIQFLVMAEILCSTVIFGFLKAMGAEDPGSYKQASMWFIGAAITIVNYLLVEFIRDTKGFHWIKQLIDLNLCFLVFLILSVVIVQFNSIPGYYFWPFQISLWGSLVTPLVTVLLILFYVCCRRNQNSG